MFVWFSLLSVCFIRRGIDYDGISWVLFASAGIIIVMSFRGSIGSGICMWVLVSESAQVYDLLLLCVLSFKMIITVRIIRKRFCWCLFMTDSFRVSECRAVSQCMMNVLLIDGFHWFHVFNECCCSVSSWCGISWFVHYECDVAIILWLLWTVYGILFERDCKMERCAKLNNMLCEKERFDGKWADCQVRHVRFFNGFLHVGGGCHHECMRWLHTPVIPVCTGWWWGLRWYPVNRIVDDVHSSQPRYSNAVAFSMSDLLS